MVPTFFSESEFLDSFFFFFLNENMNLELSDSTPLSFSLSLSQPALYLSMFHVFPSLIWLFYLSPSIGVVIDVVLIPIV